jgi:molybdopterin-binding protein
MTTYRPSEAAELLGVSVDTVRRWADEGRIATIRTPAGHRQVEGGELARVLAEQPALAEPAGMAQSARNRFTGIVVRVERDTLTALVEIQSGPHRVVSLITRDGADELGLEVGDLAVAAVKATNVVVEVPLAR